MSSYRPERVGEQIHKEVTRLLMYNIKDPRVSPVTLTGVQMSRDIGSAKIYYTVQGDSAERKEAEKGLKSASPYIRRELGKIMNLRFVPNLYFKFDESVNYGQKIDALLYQVREDLDDHSTDN
ncbi:ribosome-binding factor A [Desulfuromusa kysingii]|uniref:Ribosome-binding factor A n=1 Tax=Desulfuromusa kysingii TaxID=37625 RepID=A0A1H4D244_9BACT|nr:30S ribosome-binding factor RbfA [Desulfuromusa kysingii]SEA66392.1 ribosome-binding factor A [Desulfuromusa kysingii]